MVTKPPQQFHEVPRGFDPIRSSQPLTTRPPPIQEQQWPPRYQPTQRNYEQNSDSFNQESYATWNDSSTVFPLPALSQIAYNNSWNYEHLRIEWTESETKWEYIARYNQLRNGVWMASAPQRKISRYISKENYQCTPKSLRLGLIFSFLFRF